MLLATKLSYKLGKLDCAIFDSAIFALAILDSAIFDSPILNFGHFGFAHLGFSHLGFGHEDFFTYSFWFGQNRVAYRKLTSWDHPKRVTINVQRRKEEEDKGQC